MVRSAIMYSAAVAANLAYVASSIFAVVAAYAYFSMSFGTVTAGILALIPSCIPGVGSLFAVYAAVKAWDWSWPFAALVAFAPFLLAGIVALAAPKQAR